MQICCTLPPPVPSPHIISDTHSQRGSSGLPEQLKLLLSLIWKQPVSLPVSRVCYMSVTHNFHFTTYLIRTFYY